MRRSKSRYEIEERKNEMKRRGKAVKPTNDAIASIKSMLELAVEECNRCIHARVPNGSLELTIERLRNGEDRLIIKGNLGDARGPFTLVKILVDSSTQLTTLFQFSEKQPQEVSVDDLCRIIRAFGQRTDLA